MSTLDKAFIKAYQRHGMSGPHAPFGKPSPPAPARTAAIDTAKSTSSVPKPHLPELAHAIGDPTVESDSAQVAGTPRVRSAESPDLRKPAFEIERFKWPAVVAALLENRQSQLASLLDELLPLRRGALAVGGCRRGEGRTTVAMVVARQLAQTGARVVLVDADTERPKLAEMLGTAAEIGWIETLIDGQPACEAMIESLADRLVVLPLKGPIGDGAFQQSGDDLQRMVERLQAAFDFVCFDLGPSAESSRWQARLFAAGTRAAVVVRDVRQGRLEQAQAVGRKFAELGAAHWAIIENFV